MGRQRRFDHAGPSKGISDPLFSLRELRQVIHDLEIWLACDHGHARDADFYCGVCGAQLKKKETL